MGDFGRGPRSHLTNRTRSQSVSALEFDPGLRDHGGLRQRRGSQTPPQVVSAPDIHSIAEMRDLTVVDSIDGREDVLYSLRSLFNKPELSDVSLIVEEKKIFAHRAILAAWSPAFHAMFTTGMKEQNEEEIEIKEADYEPFVKMIEFFYTGHVEVSGKPQQIHSQVSNLLKIADRFEVERLKDSCGRYISNRVNKDNCFQYLQVAENFKLEELRQSCCKIVCRSFTPLSQTREFLEMDVFSLIACLKHEELLCPEELVYEAFIAWFHHNKDNFGTSIPDVQIPALLKSIRFPLLSAKFLVEKVKSDRLIMNYPIMQSLLLEAFEHHSYPESPGLHKNFRCRRRQRRQCLPTDGDSNEIIDMIDFLRRYNPPSSSNDS